MAYFMLLGIIDESEQNGYPMFFHHLKGGDTLYDLIEAIDGEVQPGEGRMVTGIVLDLFDGGMIKLSDSM